MKIYLSPSSQTNNIGIGNYGTEAKQMRIIAGFLETRLKQAGHKVYLAESSMTLTQRVSESNKLKVDIHIAIHSNASENHKARGAMYITKVKDSQSKHLSEHVYKRMSEITPTNDLGDFSNNTYYEPKSVHAIMCLIEVAFHDNFEDATWIATHRQLIATAISQGIEDYLLEQK